MIAELKWLGLQVFDTPVQPTTQNSLHYSDSDRDNEENFGKLLEPGLRKIFFETYDEMPEQFGSIYNVESSSKAVERDWGMGAFGDWAKRESQFDTVDYQTISAGDERSYVHEAFTQGFIVTKEMYDDEQYRQIEKMPKAMARAGRAKVEKDAMIPLVNGFFEDDGSGDNENENIYDGKPLFSEDHPLLDSDKSIPNFVEGELNDMNLKKAIQMMRETTDEAGNLVQFKPDKLIIPPALEDDAVRLLKSQQLPGSEMNDTNQFLNQYGMAIEVLDYLGETAGGMDDIWILQDSSKHELNFFWRKRPEFKWEEDFDTYVSKYRGYMRYSCGISDWRGLVGCKPA